jgi:hypothetical protein
MQQNNQENRESLIRTYIKRFLYTDYHCLTRKWFRQQLIIQLEKMNLQDLKNCPICNYKWQSDKNIYEELRDRPAYKHMTDEQVEEIAKQYLHTKDNPKYFKKLIGVEIQGEYDGISRWMCPECKSEWNRFTEELIHQEVKILEENERS